MQDKKLQYPSPGQERCRPRWSGQSFMGVECHGPTVTGFTLLRLPCKELGNLVNGVAHARLTCVPPQVTRVAIIIYHVFHFTD